MYIYDQLQSAETSAQSGIQPDTVVEELSVDVHTNEPNMLDAGQERSVTEVSFVRQIDSTMSSTPAKPTCSTHADSVKLVSGLCELPC